MAASEAIAFKVPFSSRIRCQALTPATKPPAPIAWPTLHVHHRYNPNRVRVVQKNDGVGEGPAKMPARRRIKTAEALRIGADLPKQALYLAIEAHAEFGRNLGIVSNRVGEFLVRLGMKQVPHSPASLRTRASEAASGTPSI